MEITNDMTLGDILNIERHIACSIAKETDKLLELQGLINKYYTSDDMYSTEAMVRNLIYEATDTLWTAADLAMKLTYGEE